MKKEEKDERFITKVWFSTNYDYTASIGTRIAYPDISQVFDSKLDAEIRASENIINKAYKAAFICCIEYNLIDMITNKNYNLGSGGRLLSVEPLSDEAIKDLSKRRKVKELADLRNKVAHLEQEIGVPPVSYN